MIGVCMAIVLVVTLMTGCKPATPTTPVNDSGVAFESIELFTTDGVELRSRPVDWRSAGGENGTAWRMLDADDTINHDLYHSVEYHGGYAYFMRSDGRTIRRAPQTGTVETAFTNDAPIADWRVSLGGKYVAIYREDGTHIDIWSINPRKLVQTIEAQTGAVGEPGNPSFDQFGAWSFLKENGKGISTFTAAVVPDAPAGHVVSLLQVHIDENVIPSVEVRHIAETAQNMFSWRDYVFDAQDEILACDTYPFIVDVDSARAFAETGAVTRLYVYSLRDDKSYAVDERSTCRFPPRWVGPGALEFNITPTIGTEAPGPFKGSYIVRHDMLSLFETDDDAAEPQVVPTDGPQVSALILTNVTDSAYDAVPLTWDVGNNTLQSSGTVALHANNTGGEATLCWLPASPATPIFVVQQWSRKNRLPLLTKATSSGNDLLIRTPPTGMQYTSPATGSPLARWSYGESFVATQGELETPTTLSTPKTNLDGMSITITERSMWQIPGVVNPPKDKILTVPIPAGQVRIEVLYGSGGVDNGFVLVQAEAPHAVASLWLIRMNNGTGTIVRCGDVSAFGGNLIAGPDPSFVRVGSLLYLTHGSTKIGCIDTAAASPSMTFPEKLNALLTKLFDEGPQDYVAGSLQAQLAYDGALIIEYPDASRNSVYYALDESGTVLSHLRVSKDAITSIDAQGRQGSTLKTPGSPGYVSLPSYDLFQRNIF